LIFLEYHSVKYDEKFNQTSCHCIQYGESSYGIIKNFIEIDFQSFAFVQRLEHVTPTHSVYRKSELISSLLKRFFPELRLINSYEIVLLTTNIKRMVRVSTDGEIIMLTPVVENEHD
jgi:hypothetical protein